MTDRCVGHMIPRHVSPHYAALRPPQVWIRDVTTHTCGATIFAFRCNAVMSLGEVGEVRYAGAGRGGAGLRCGVLGCVTDFHLCLLVVLFLQHR